MPLLHHSASLCQLKKVGSLVNLYFLNIDMHCFIIRIISWHILWLSSASREQLWCRESSPASGEEACPQADREVLVWGWSGKRTCFYLERHSAWSWHAYEIDSIVISAYSVVFLVLFLVCVAACLSELGLGLKRELLRESFKKTSLFLARSHKTSVKTLVSFQLLQGPRAAASCLSATE